MITTIRCWLLLLLTILCTSCANQPVQNATLDSSEVLEEHNQEKQPALPLHALDADIMSQLLLMNLASHQSEWEEASSNAHQAAINSRDQRLARVAALLAIKAKDYSRAFEAANLWYELEPDDKDAYNTMLLSLAATGAVDDIRAKYSELLVHDVDDGIKQATGLLLKQPNADAAIDLMTYFVAKYNDVAQVMLSAAYVARGFKRTDLENQWLDNALKIDPDSETAVKMKLAVMPAGEERKALINRYLQTNPSSIDVRLSQAKGYLDEQNYLGAQAIIESVLQDEPDHKFALIQAAIIAEQLNDLTATEKFYKKILRLYPDDDRIRWYMAGVQQQQQRYERAERYYQAITDDQYWFNAQLQVASMRYEMSGLEPALRHLSRLYPETSEQYIDYVIARHYLLFEEQHLDEAMGYINEAVLLLPEDAQFRYARGLLAAQMEQIALAEQDLRYVLQKKPEDANALNALGYTLADQTDRYQEARELIEQALALRPDDGHILDSMGWVLYRQENYAEAIDYLQRAYQLTPDAEVAAHLGEVLWESGQTAEAERVWQEAITQDRDHDALRKTMQHYGISMD